MKIKSKSALWMKQFLKNLVIAGFIGFFCGIKVGVTIFAAMFAVSFIALYIIKALFISQKDWLPILDTHLTYSQLKRKIETGEAITDKDGNPVPDMQYANVISGGALDPLFHTVHVKDGVVTVMDDKDKGYKEVWQKRANEYMGRK